MSRLLFILTFRVIGLDSLLINYSLNSLTLMGKNVRYNNNISFSRIAIINFEILFASGWVGGTGLQGKGDEGGRLHKQTTAASVSLGLCWSVGKKVGGGKVERSVQASGESGAILARKADDKQLR